MNHSGKPKEYDQGIFSELIKQGRIKLVKHRFSPYCKENKGRCPECEKVMTELSPEDVKTLEAPTWWHYLIVRKELKDGPLLAQLGHAAGYSAAKLGGPLPERTRVVVLQATKEQFGEVFGKIMGRQDEAGRTLYAMYESEGQLAGCYTAMGFLTNDKQSIIEVVGDLKLWKKDKAEVPLKDLIIR